ncbi:hypothetical protein MF573_00335 [Klebsiella pneumoniae]|nr:hypothetical protein MF573_00335 [Klebsiella pneumoniae]
MLSFSVVKSAGSAGNYYTDKDNYYVLGSMGERWAGQGAEQLGLQGQRRYACFYPSSGGQAAGRERI